MNGSKIAARLLHITPALRHYHDHRLDPAQPAPEESGGGRYFMRLPNGIAVPIDQYEEKLRAYWEAEAQRKQGPTT